MQRIVLTAFLTTLTIGSALAGPLSLDPDITYGTNRPAARNAAGQRPAAAPEVQAPPVRQVAAQSYGGGFLEYLFGGGNAPRYEQPSTPVYYGNQQVPGDLGPGMVESPYSPGRPVADPRYMRQEVSYPGKEAAGTIIVNTNERMLYLVQSERQGDPLRHRRRPAGLHLGGHAPHHQQARMAGLDAARRDAQAPPRSAAPHGRRPG